MANLTPVSSFDNVYQLELTDFVIGGPGGTSNVQAQQLLNRTLYLKNLIDALDGSGGPFDYDASGGALPTTGSGSGGTIKRKDTYKVSVAGTVSGIALQVGDTLIAKIDGATTAANYILLQTNVDLATASVLGLVKLAQNIGGGALTDTCLSLAGLISIFAQLASPTFTGTPAAPTAAPGTNTTQLATTAFAAAAVAVEAGTRASADTTLQNNITSEASTRSGADTTLQNNINSEASTRGGADTTLQNNIDALNDGLVAWTTSGLSLGSGVTNTSFKFKKTGRNTVKLVGWLDKSSAPTGTVFATLPAGYRPPATIIFPISAFGFLGGPGWHVTIDTGGAITIFQFNLASGTMSGGNWSFDNIEFDL